MRGVSVLVVVGIAVASACSDPHPDALPVTVAGQSSATAVAAAASPTLVRREVLAPPIGVGEALWPTPVWSGRELFVAVVAAAGSTRLLRHDPRANSWLASSPAPFDARDQLVSVVAWSGSEVLVAIAPSPSDGRAMTEYQYSLYAFDPLTDRWRELAAPPRELRLWTLHWTGTEILALGRGSSASANDAASYSPSNDSWHVTRVPSSIAALSPTRAFTVGRRTLFLMGQSERLTGLLYDAAKDSWSWHVTRAAQSNTTLAFLHGSEVIVARRGVDETTGRVDAFDIGTGQWVPRRDTRFGDGPQICTGRALPTTSGAIVSFCSRPYRYDALSDLWTELPNDAVQVEPPGIVAAEVDGWTYAFEWDNRDTPLLTRLTVMTR